MEIEYRFTLTKEDNNVRGRPLGAKNKQKMQRYDVLRVRMIKTYKEMGATYKEISHRMGVPKGSIGYLINKR